MSTVPENRKSRKAGGARRTSGRGGEAITKVSDTELQRRLAELEGTCRVPGSDPRRFWSAWTTPLGGPTRKPPRPAASLQGEVRLHGEVRWSITLAARSILDLPDTSAAKALAALAHPTRAAIARRLLAGPATVAELQQATGVTSAGRLYHHLNTLSSCRAVEPAGRSVYRVPARAVVPHNGAVARRRRSRRRTRRGPSALRPRPSPGAVTAPHPPAAPTSTCQRGRRAPGGRSTDRVAAAYRAGLSPLTSA